jgi:hypothetical protein
MRISIYAGDTNTLRFSAVDALGAALNLTGLTIEWGLSRPAKTVRLLTKTVGAGLTVTNAAGGLFEARLLPADTAGMDGEYYQEVQITDVDGNVSTIYAGAVRITKTLILPT